MATEEFNSLAIITFESIQNLHVGRGENRCLFLRQEDTVRPHRLEVILEILGEEQHDGALGSERHGGVQVQSPLRLCVDSVVEGLNLKHRGSHDKWIVFPSVQDGGNTALNQFCNWFSIVDFDVEVIPFVLVEGIPETLTVNCNRVSVDALLRHGVVIHPEELASELRPGRGEAIGLTLIKQNLIVGHLVLTSILKPVRHVNSEMAITSWR